MRKAVRSVILFLVVCFFDGMVSVPEGLPADRPPAVLVLSSYHQGYEWSDRQIEGLIAGLQAVYPTISPFIEYLDLRRFPEESYAQQLKALLAEKCRGRNLDAAIVLDNPAFDLILAHRADILPEVPVVFAGIDGFKPAMLEGQRRITGIAEVRDYQGTLALALALHPGTRQVFAVNDHTPSGMAVRREMEAVRQAFRDRVEVVFNAPATYEELEAQIADLPPHAIVFIAGFSTDREGVTLNLSLSTEKLTARARVPVYATHDTRLGHGIVGGMLIGSQEHGLHAAALALRVLAGEEPDSIPVDTRGTSRPMFDYRQLKRFNIPVDALPAGSMIMNRPVSFYQKHKDVLWTGAGVVAALLSLVLCLAALLARKNRAERALRESEDRYRLLLNVVPDSISVFVDERFVFINPSGLEMLGAKSADEVLGRPIWDFCHPDYRLLGEQRFRQCLKEGVCQPLAEFEITRLDGKGGTVESAAVPVMYQGRNAVLAVWRDITDSIQAERSLRESEANFRLLVETAPEAIFIQTKGRFAYLNSAALKLFGAESADQLLRRPAFERIHPDFHRAVHERAQILTREQRPVPSMEEVYLKMDGGHIDVDVSAVPFKFQGQNGALVFVRDITGRKKVEAALRESEENYRLFFDNALDAIFIAQDGVIKFPNQRVLDWSGLSAEKLKHVAFETFIHPEDRAAAVERYQRRLRGENIPMPNVFRLIHPKGQEFWVQASAVSIDWEGRPAQLNFVRDITAQKKLEDQLVQAQKMEAIGSLAGGIAHDFNNILSVIIGNSEILDLTNAVESSAKDSLSQIMAAAQRAKQLVKQILAFSRHTKQEKHIINLKPIVKETIEFLRSSLPAAIQLKYHLDPNSGQVLADTTQMQQVLMNLCTNASHAMETEGGVLEIDLRNVELAEEDVRFESEVEAGGYARLTVSDTGHGIDPTILSRIFEPYFTTKEQGKGTGLGLSVVHGIIKSYGGMIRVYSEMGKGTSFRVYVPLAGDLAMSEAAPPGPLPTGDERILFVDDEPVLADISRRMLGRLGYRVEVRTSPVEALEAFRANPGKFDLVITDMNMPQMTGLKLARKLTEIRPGTAIILCTGFSDQANEERAQAMGIRAFLLKPMVMRDLAEAVRKALDEPWRQNAAAHEERKNPS
ncbi:MAG: PAS domain S-box protein [Deltaproteobacteria bacterium]|nr:PAS domain S-box protein [Deltaproteobacteria bacterium]